MPVRDATEDDAAACAAIYAPYVTDTSITFEYEPPSPAEMARRIAAAQRAHAWLVLEDSPTGDKGRVVGYAYAGPYKERAAYRWSCEVSVYLEMGRRRSGSGRLLYEALFARLATRGFRILVAVMTVPNPASEGLHHALGFEFVGTIRRVGWKRGQWHDVAFAQRSIGPDGGRPAELR